MSRFGGLLSRLEKKPACKGRSLETFLTYPMHQVKKLYGTNEGQCHNKYVLTTKLLIKAYIINC